MGHAKLVLDDPARDYPDFLKRAAKHDKGLATQELPILFDLEQKESRHELEALLNGAPGLDIVDNYAEQYAELLLSKNAHLYRANYEVQVASIGELINEHYAGRHGWQLGSWVYFPWRRQLVHILGQKDFEALRTIRNRDLITADEQKKLFDFETVSFGMSVGSAGALALGITGISRRLKLVDGAVISGSNLNRILTGVSSVGKPKAQVMAEHIYEMNPYSVIECFDKVAADNIADIFDSPWPVKLAIDEIDDIEMKVRIRVEARKRRIPVIMATELGDTITLDVERFDLEPNRPLLHNTVPGLEQLLENKVENYREWMRTIVKMIDIKNMPLTLQKSLLKIGTTIVTHPQLGSTVMLTGGVLAFAAKSIALGRPLESGRYEISLEKLLLADHKTRRYRREHKRHTKVLKSAIDSM